MIKISHLVNFGTGYCYFHIWGEIVAKHHKCAWNVVLRQNLGFFSLKTTIYAQKNAIFGTCAWSSILTWYIKPINVLRKIIICEFYVATPGNCWRMLLRLFKWTWKIYQVSHKNVIFSGWMPYRTKTEYSYFQLIGEIVANL
jgi:hypothetical protein